MAELRTGTKVAGHEVWHAGNDGHASGLDADTLDGKHVSELASQKSLEHVTGHLVLGNNDWSNLIYRKNKEVYYSAADKGLVLKGVSNWSYVKVQMPIEPNAYYYCRARVKKKSGEGVFYLGAVPLDNSYQEMQTDQAMNWNYFCAVNVQMNVGETKIFEGLISGYNTTEGNDHKKFDPEANYFNLVLIGNYMATSEASETVIESLELIKCPDKFFVGNKEVFHQGNDGHASGLDADTVDGKHASDFLLNNSDINLKDKRLLFNVGTTEGTTGVTITDHGAIHGEHDQDTEISRLVFSMLDNTNDSFVFRNGGSGGTPTVDSVIINQYETKINNELKVGTNKVWHAGNDGHASGLDADTVDGKHASDFFLNNSDINLKDKRLFFNVATREGTAGIALTDGGCIYGEHDQDTENSRLVLSIADNDNDAIVLRTYKYNTGVQDSVVVNADRTIINNRLQVGTNEVWHQGNFNPNYYTPPGMITYYPAITPPVGWLECNGTAVSRTAYAALFAVIGTTYGAGDGITTFNLPDLRGEFIRGWDHGRAVDPERVLGGFQLDTFQGHHHYLWAGKNDSWHNHVQGGSVTHVGDSYPSNNTRQNVDQIGEARTDGINGMPRIANETRPRNIALMACIKY